ncbi:MAG TPA: DUF2894 domain-containing protein [Variovorax sp.]|nr:DUF2894 domain-containing protein [Variovorax sp.]
MRERGDDRLDPVRFRFIEALAARAISHDGDTRRLLDGRITALLAAYGKKLEDSKARCAEQHTAVAGQGQRGPLAELVGHIARHAPPPAADPETLAYFRITWSRLSANRRLTQSLAKVPENAGPLNSHHLVHRSLRLMRELSPEYLHRFVAYVDGLLWLEQLNTGGAPARAESPRTERRGKAARSSAG